MTHQTTSRIRNKLSGAAFFRMPPVNNFFWQSRRLMPTLPLGSPFDAPSGRIRRQPHRNLAFTARCGFFSETRRKTPPRPPDGPIAFARAWFSGRVSRSETWQTLTGEAWRLRGTKSQPKFAVGRCLDFWAVRVQVNVIAAHLLSIATRSWTRSYEREKKQKGERA